MELRHLLFQILVFPFLIWLWVILWLNLDKSKELIYFKCYSLFGAGTQTCPFFLWQSLKELIEKVFFDPLNSNKMPVFICFVISLNGISMWALLYFRELIFRSTFLDLFLKWNVEKPKQSLSKALSESLADLRIRLGDLSTTMSFSDFARCFVFRMSGYASVAFVCAACLPVWQYWKKLWCCFEEYPTCRNRRELINLNVQICWCL